MTLLDVLRAIVEKLNAADIPHMVAGSVASSHHGEPRSTQDIDLVIDPAAASLQRFVRSLDPATYYVGDAMRALADRSEFNVVSLTTGWKVDPMIRRDRPFSRSEFDRRQTSDIAGVRVQVATAEDTILAKLEWGAPSGSDRQHEDVVAIMRAQRSELDIAYLRHWADELHIRDALESALDESAS